MALDARFKTERVARGTFDVYWDSKKTAWQIVNGCIGLTGRDTANIYGIRNRNTDSVKWIGPLHSCKSGLAYSLAKRAQA